METGSAFDSTSCTLELSLVASGEDAGGFIDEARFVGLDDVAEEVLSVGVRATLEVVLDTVHLPTGDPVTHSTTVFQMLNEEHEVSIRLLHQLLAHDADELVGQEVEAEVELIRREEIEETLHRVTHPFTVE
jgi:hypothetical protein